MALPKEAKPTFPINLYGMDIEETPFSLYELIDGLDYYKKFRELHRVDTEMLVRVIEELCVHPRHLFEFTVNTGDSMLVRKNGVFVERWVKEGNRMKPIVDRYDLHITYNGYAECSLNKVAKYLLEDAFTFIAERPFVEKGMRFQDDVKKITGGTLLSDVGDILFRNEITAMDVHRLMEDPRYAETMVDKSRFTVYANGDIFLRLECDEVLYLRISDFYERDWSAIENRKRTIVGKNGDICSQLQRDFPWFGDPLVIKLKEMLTSDYTF